MTVQVWLKAITRNRVFDQVQDTPRIREAFAMLAERSKRWPSPSDFIASLPSNVVPFQRQPKIESDENRLRNLRHIAEINEKLGIPVPNLDDDPTPPRAA